VTVEVTGKLADPQMVAKVKQHYGIPRQGIHA
jgi:hypothetical protein